MSTDDDALAKTHAAGASDSGVDSTLLSAPGSPSSEAITKPELNPGPRRPPHPALLDVDMEHYDVERELGRGGMGRILIARDRRLDREVALKLIRENAGASLASRFEREARITARLQHPAIVPVYEAGRFAGDQPFYAMKLVSGRPLDAVLADAGELADRLKLLPLLVSVCDALAYAHDRRVIHRDLKPQNVLCGDFGEVVVIDWGLAKDLTDTAPEAPVEAAKLPHASGDSLTIHGEIMGTPAYMPPEQARGDAVDERADVYALGAILFRLLAGRAPFHGQSSREVILKVQLGTPAQWDALPGDVPADLAAIVKKAMAPRAADRYPTAKELAADLRRFQEGRIVGVHRYTAWQLVSRWIRKHRAAVTAYALALAVLATMGVLAVIRIDRERQEAVRQRERAEAAQGFAEARAREAVAQRAALLEEQGRQEILDGRPLRALPYLAEAYRMAPDSVALRALLPEALRPIDAEQRVLTGPGGELTRALFTPDGTRIVTTSGRGAVRLFAPSGEVLATIGDGLPPGERLAAASPSGERVVLSDPAGALTLHRGGKTTALPAERPTEILFFVSEERVVALDADGARLIDVDAARVVRQLPAGAPGEVSAVSLSGDGRLLAVARGVRAVVWELGTGAEVRRFVHVPDAAAGDDDFEVQQPIRSLELDPAGKLALSVTRDDARVWDLRTGKQTRRLSPEEAKVGLQFGTLSPDGTRALLARGDGGVHVWDLASGRVTAVLSGHTQVVLAAVWRDDGLRVATASEDRTARLWDPADGRLLATFGEHDDGVTDIGFAPDDKRLVTASRDGTARIWDATATRLREGSGAPLTAGELPEDPQITFAGEVVKVWDPRTGELVRVLRGHHGDCTAYARSGTLLLTGSWDRTARLWDLGARTGEPLVELPMEGVVWVAGLSPDGKSALVADELGHARLFEVPSGKAGPEIKGPEKRLLGGGFSPDGRTVAVAGEAGKIWIADARSGALLRTIDAHRGWIKELAFSPDGRRIATAELEGTAAVFSVDDGTLVARLAGAPTETLALAFSPDGRRLITGAKTGAAALWDAETGRLEVALDGHGAEVVRASFSPDGDRVVTACFDGAARVWDAHTGRILARFAGDGDPLRAAAFSADGTRVVTTTTFGVTRIWDVHLETRSPDAVQAALARTKWRLVGGQLVRAAD